MPRLSPADGVHRLPVGSASGRASQFERGELTRHAAGARHLRCSERLRSAARAQPSFCNVHVVVHRTRRRRRTHGSMSCSAGGRVLFVVSQSGSGSTRPPPPWEKSPPTTSAAIRGRWTIGGIRLIIASLAATRPNGSSQNRGHEQDAREGGSRPRVFRWQATPRSAVPALKSSPRMAFSDPPLWPD